MKTPIPFVASFAFVVPAYYEHDEDSVGYIVWGWDPKGQNWIRLSKLQRLAMVANKIAQTYHASMRMLENIPDDVPDTEYTSALLEHDCEDPERNHSCH